jgi:hypothetical protein
MKNQSAIIAMLAILSIAALVGVFTVQVADAQLPRLSVGATGLEVETEEFDIFAGERGLGIVTEEFTLEAGPRAEPDGVRLDTEEFGLSANPSGIFLDPRE